MLKLEVQLALSHFDLHVKEAIPSSGITSLFGPSGSGKSTLLRAIAGFESFTGRVQFTDQIWYDSSNNLAIRPEKRRIGFVRQQPHLIPHLSVLANLRLAKRFSRHTNGSGRKLEEVVSQFDLESLLQTYPDTLSGGETQRVALAQTVINDPQLILLDEPLTGLDSARKAEILPYLKRFSREFKRPMIYVSHEIDEIDLASDYVLCLEEGNVIRSGAVSSMSESIRFHASLGKDEASSLLTATFERFDSQYSLAQLTVGEQSLVVPSTSAFATNQKVPIKIDARDVSIALEPLSSSSIRNTLKGTIIRVDRDESAPSGIVTVDVGEAEIQAHVTRKSMDELALTVGQDAFAVVKGLSISTI